MSPLRGGTYPAKFHWQRSRRIPQYSFPERHEVGRYIRKELYVTVVVSSDTALFQGLTEHMTKELTPLTRDLTEDLMRISLSKSTLSLPPQRGKLFELSKRLCCMRFVDDTELKPTAEFDKKTHVLSDGNIIIVAPNVSVARMFFTSQVSLAKKPAESTTPLPGAT